MDKVPLHDLLQQVRDCRICADELPLGPRPVVRISPTATVLIIGQAPGTKVHASGIPWDDPSGDRLRQWLQLDKAEFYDENHIAIVPMGLCYPGKGKSGDLPPRKECAPQWHQPLFEHLPSKKLTLLIGQYAQNYYLPEDFKRRYKTLTEKVKHGHELAKDIFPLPHPSPRNQLWLKRNPWFDEEILPRLRQQLHQSLS
ncbi:uracil-DNA glycosylase family protein [Maricurvus nonylphenolicus]|uniref:uracil-DNA glycosylase family protein n=1 Tax=Maricurvus nonylphenolicus TaxID=1008307 RepID=UPI0036F332A2